jgi:glutathione S-transferase
MIELLQFQPALGLMNLSPFCMKVEVFLRLAKLDYRCVNGVMPFKGPKGKLPVIRDGNEVIADSSAIIEYLQRKHAATLNPLLKAQETGVTLALKRLLEEDLYFTALWSRWIDDAGWAVTLPAFFEAVPSFVRPVIGALIRRKIRRDLIGQGIGRMSLEEIARRACADLDAVEAMLGYKAFFAGDEPGAIDASAYAFLANLLWAPYTSSMRSHAQKSQSLNAYAQRMKGLVGQS